MNFLLRKIIKLLNFYILNCYLLIFIIFYFLFWKNKKYFYKIYTFFLLKLILER